MIWQLVVIGLGLGLNNALGSVALGARRMRRVHQLRIALVFALFEALMPVIGILVGGEVAAFVGGGARYFGVGILMILGIYFILKKNDNSKEDTHSTGFYTILLAVMLSIDNLTVGFGLGMLNVPLWTASLMFGLISLLMTVAGLEIGRYMGDVINLSADKLSGGILVVTGVLMALPWF